MSDRFRQRGHVVQSYGGPKGSGTEQVSSPTHLAVDRNGSVFVADFNNKRVLLLSPELTFVREILSQLRWAPLRLWLDPDERRLYVGINKYKDGKHTAGNVVCGQHLFMSFFRSNVSIVHLL